MSLIDRWMGVIEEAAVPTGDAGTEFRAGARLAANGAVADLEVTPGMIEATVDHRHEVRAAIGVAPLGEAFWTQFIELVAANPSWQIQLDTHRVPEDLAAAMVPSSVVLTPSCSCDTWSGWCRHVVAVAAAFGESLAADPFGVVTVFGSSRDRVLPTTRTLTAMPYGLDQGTSAAAAYRKAAAEAPRVAPAAATHRSPSSLGVPPPAGSGITAERLLDVIDDASRRAHAVLTGESQDLSLMIPVGLDVIRRAATGDVEAVSAETGLDRAELAAAASAWRVGGAAAVRALRDRWDCPPERLSPARAWLGAAAKVRANTVSDAGLQLRLDRDAQWWRLARRDDLGWMIVAGPAATVADVMALIPGEAD